MDRCQRRSQRPDRTDEKEAASTSPISAAHSCSSGSARSPWSVSARPGRGWGETWRDWGRGSLRLESAPLPAPTLRSRIFHPVWTGGALGWLQPRDWAGPSGRWCKDPAWVLAMKGGDGCSAGGRTCADPWLGAKSSRGNVGSAHPAQGPSAQERGLRGCQRGHWAPASWGWASVSVYQAPRPRSPPPASRRCPSTFPLRTD